MNADKEDHAAEPSPSEQSIGRPGPWHGSDHTKDGKDVGASVVRRPGEGPRDATSTPVTRRDYESLKK